MYSYTIRMNLDLNQGKSVGTNKLILTISGVELIGTTGGNTRFNQIGSKFLLNRNENHTIFGVEIRYLNIEIFR